MRNDMYGIYKNARNASWQFLIDNEIRELPIRLGNVCHELGCRILEDSKVHYLKPTQRGVSFYQNGVWNIVLNDKLTPQAQRYTIAHELGHIFLGHQTVEGKYGRTFIMNSPEEYQAERFAIGILAPACVLWGLNLHTPQEIAQLCNISITSATKRARRMEELYRRSMFLSHPLERQVFKQFEDFINETKNKM